MAEKAVGEVVALETAPVQAMVPAPVMVKEVDPGLMAVGTEEVEAAVAEAVKVEVADLAMGPEAGTGLALDMAPVEPTVEAMEAVEVVEVAAAPAEGMEAEVDRVMDPAVAQGTARGVVPMEGATEAAEAAAAARALGQVLGLAMVPAMGLDTGVEVVDTLS